MTEHSASPVFIRVHAEALEDLHAGTGTGSGDIDSHIERDRHGQPVIRDTHFKGVLREAGNELIKYGQITTNDLRALLGAPGAGRGALTMTSLRITAGGNTLVWAASARVPGSRVPQQDTLRFVEYVAAGTRFAATLRLPNDTHCPLLDTLLSRVDRLGGKRNRGPGLIRLGQEPCQPDKPRHVGSRTESRLRLILRNLEPLCLPATGHPGNLVQTHSFIRGRTLRGSLLAWAIREGSSPDPTLFDRISFGDALPLPSGCSQADAAIPIPLSVLTEKPTGGSTVLPWWVAQTATEALAADSLGESEAETPAEKRKRPGEHEYVATTNRGKDWARYSPQMRVRLRNATPEEGSRKDAELFSMEEIAEDTRFQADLLFPDQASVQEFLQLYGHLINPGDWLEIGRGGRPVCIESIDRTPQVEAPAHNQHESWTLTLTSDLIRRGPDLGFMDNLDIGWLYEVAGIEPQGCHIEKEMVSTQTVHGFNAVTGLPMAPALAIRRGSCWIIQGNGCGALATALRDKQALGERTGEGFGRFLINIQPLENLAVPARTPAALEVNQFEELRQWAQELANNISAKGPSLSQLQWLRSHALAADETGLAQLLKEITNAHHRRPQGGSGWGHFPTGALRETLDHLPTLAKKRQLVSELVKQYDLKQGRDR